MKQVLQNLKTGESEVANIPTPQVKAGHVLIRSRASVVSAGTEKMLVDFGKANLIAKARQQPERVRQVVEKIGTDGLMPTLHAVKTKLDQPIPLGYSNAGVVIAVGSGVHEFSVGDRVVSNGPHAEYVSVPKNLCAKIPDNVNDDTAAFTVITSIGLQGIRLAQPTLGETFFVMGLGLIGLLTVQLLKAHGCKVIGSDFNSERLSLASQLGAEVVDLSKGEDPVSSALHYTNGRGVDGVLITASTKSNDPIHQAALMSRKRGRIVLIGVTGLQLSRADFYEKELSFQVSCSYGPGRYDQRYEEKGFDYPIGFVRWTEQRNFEAVLDMFSERKIVIDPLVTHRYSIDEAVEAYRALSEGASLGIVIRYADAAESPQKSVALSTAPAERNEVSSNERIVVGMIGAGNYTNQTLMPVLKKAGVSLHSIASSGGVNSVHVGKRYGFGNATTDTETILHHSEVNTVFITTRHNTHSRFVIEALKSGKHVFVEKPLCLTLDDLEQIRRQKESSPNILMVGFNRRFAPHVLKMRQLLAPIAGPKTFIMTVNAGFIPKDHWTQDPEVGGGRIVGEACHFIDLLRYLVGHPIVGVQASAVVKQETVSEDIASITLSFADGSLGTIHYFANGHKSFPKERLDVFADGRILHLDNFKTLRGYGWSGFKKFKLWNQDKGHRNGVEAFFSAIRDCKGDPIPVDEIYEVTKVSFEAARLIQESRNKEGQL